MVSDRLKGRRRLRKEGSRRLRSPLLGCRGVPLRTFQRLVRPSLHRPSEPERHEKKGFYDYAGEGGEKDDDRERCVESPVVEPHCDRRGVLNREEYDYHECHGAQESDDKFHSKPPIGADLSVTPDPRSRSSSTAPTRPMATSRRLRARPKLAGLAERSFAVTVRNDYTIGTARFHKSRSLAAAAAVSLAGSVSCRDHSVLLRFLKVDNGRGKA